MLILNVVTDTYFSQFKVINKFGWRGQVSNNAVSKLLLKLKTLVGLYSRFFYLLGIRYFPVAQIENFVFASLILFFPHHLSYVIEYGQYLLEDLV